MRENDQIMEILNTTYEKLSMSDLRDGRDFQGETFQILKKTLESILKNKGQKYFNVVLLKKNKIF